MLASKVSARRLVFGDLCGVDVANVEDVRYSGGLKELVKATFNVNKWKPDGMLDQDWESPLTSHLSSCL